MENNDKAAPAFQDGAAASGAWQRLLDAAKESIRLHDEVTGGYDYGYISLDLRFAIEAVEAEKVAQSGMAGSACQGGNTNPESPGIDHAKLADELADLLFALILCVKNGDDPKPRTKAIQEYVAGIVGQARGQQAGDKLNNGE